MRTQQKARTKSAPWTKRPKAIKFRNCTYIIRYLVKPRVWHPNRRFDKTKKLNQNRSPFLPLGASYRQFVELCSKFVGSFQIFSDQVDDCISRRWLVRTVFQVFCINIEKKDMWQKLKREQKRVLIISFVKQGVSDYYFLLGIFWIVQWIG